MSATPAPAPREEGFFIGWARALPAGLGGFLARVAAAVLVGASAAAVLLSAAVEDPGGGDAFWGEPPVTLRGVLTLRPYPVLHLPPDAANPAGRAVLLSGPGKTGVEADPALEGRLVEASGPLLRRGSQEQIQVDPGGFVALEGAGAAPRAEPLGTWRITGEICDGKCWNGAMRPATGITHRACAAFCLVGGLPAVFYPTRPLPGTGAEVLVLGGPDGGPMPEALRDQVGLRITLDGQVERRGGLLVFLADPASLRRP